MADPRLHATVGIDGNLARKLVAPYGLHVEAVSPLDGGVVNTNVRVDTSSGAFVLRVYRAGRSRPEVEFEVSVLSRLSEAGVPCQRPLTTATGPVSRWNDRLYTVLTYLEGDVGDETTLSAQLSRDVGATLARMQTALDGFVPVGAKPRADLTFVDELLPQTLALLHDHGEPDTARHVATSWAQARAPFLADDLPQGVVHADLCPDNTVLRGGRLAGILDFDDAYYGTLLFDVALAATEFAFRGETNLDLQLVTELVTAYEDAGRSAGDRSQLVHAMWVNCYKFFAYTLPLTLAASEPPAANPYLQHVSYFSDFENRTAIAESLQFSPR